MTQQEDVRIFDFIIRTAWLHFEDALSIGKIKLFAGTYRQGQGKADTTATHYLDVPMFRPHLADLSWGKPVEFMDFKGSPAKGDQPCESRILRVNSDPEGNVWWSLVHGPGKVTKTGAIQPDYPKGKYDKLIRVKMTRDEARMMACQLIEYLQAYTTVQILQRQSPQQRPAVSVEKANEDWFSIHDIPNLPQAPKTAVNGNGYVNGHVNGNGHLNGNGATAVADAPPKPKATKVNHPLMFSQKKYGDGHPVNPQDIDAYTAFYSAKRQVPTNRERLNNWYFGQ